MASMASSKLPLSLCVLLLFDDGWFVEQEEAVEAVPSDQRPSGLGPVCGGGLVERVVLHRIGGPDDQDLVAPLRGTQADVDGAHFCGAGAGGVAVAFIPLFGRRG